MMLKFGLSAEYPYKTDHLKNTDTYQRINRSGEPGISSIGIYGNQQRERTGFRQIDTGWFINGLASIDHGNQKW